MSITYCWNKTGLSILSSFFSFHGYVLKPLTQKKNLPQQILWIPVESYAKNYSNLPSHIFVFHGTGWPQGLCAPGKHGTTKRTPDLQITNDVLSADSLRRSSSHSVANKEREGNHLHGPGLLGLEGFLSCSPPLGSGLPKEARARGSAIPAPESQV